MLASLVSEFMRIWQTALTVRCSRISTTSATRKRSTTRLARASAGGTRSSAAPHRLEIARRKYCNNTVWMGSANTTTGRSYTTNETNDSTYMYGWLSWNSCIGTQGGSCRRSHSICALPSVRRPGLTRLCGLQRPRCRRGYMTSVDRAHEGLSSMRLKARELT